MVLTATVNLCDSAVKHTNTYRKSVANVRDIHANHSVALHATGE